MAKSCSYIPKRNGITLDGWFDYKRALGYQKAAKVFSISIAPSYIEENKDILKLDKQGVPTLETTLRTPMMKRCLAQDDRIEALRKQYRFDTVADTDENFRMLVNEAKTFNGNEPDFIAYVESTDGGITVGIHPKSDKALHVFNNQYGTLMLNDRLLEIFRPLGVTPSILSASERAGNTGLVDFSKAKAIAGQFSDLIRVAQGMEGQMAVSEEFSHLIVRSLISQPFIQRLLDTYSSNPDSMREILGDEYDRYVREYTDEEGNVDYTSIAEECVGRQLQEHLLKNHDIRPKNYFERLVDRLVKMIHSMVRNLSSKDVDDAVINADQMIDDLAKSILTGSTQLSQEDIEDTFVFEDEFVYSIGDSNIGYNDKIDTYKNARNAQDLLKLIAENGDSEGIKMLAKSLIDMEHLKYVPIYLDWSPLHTRKKDNKNILGTYNSKTNRITLSVPQTGESFENTALHEIIHAITVRAYNTDSQFKKSMDSLYKAAKQSFPNSTAYGFTDVYEFMSESMTDLNFIKKLNSIPYSAQGSSSTSLFKAFVDYIVNYIKTNISSVEPYSKSTTLYNAVTSTIEQYSRVVFNSEYARYKNTHMGNSKMNRRAVMHHLDATVDYLDTVIDNALVAEMKKTHIFKNDELLNKAKIREASLRAIQTASPEGKLKGLLNYAKAAADDLKQTEVALRKASMQDNNIFSLLRSARMTLQSYTPFIEQLGEMLRSGNEELSRLIGETAIENPDKTIESLHSLFDSLNSLNTHIKGRFENLALDAFENFLKPFFDQEVFIDKHGKQQTLREAIEEANGDISFIDRWLQTMSTSGDIILQLFDSIVKKAKNKARLQTIEDVREIIRLQTEAEEAGITDFEYFFEKDDKGHKTGNYISEVNYGQYREDFNEMIRSLDEKYGENPRGEQSRLKAQERRNWLKVHAQSMLEGDEPNASMYHNSEYDKLTAKQKDILEKYKALKKQFDKRYPKNRVNSNKAIQRRKTKTERRLDLAKGPSAIFNDIKESMKKDFLETADDDQTFGQKTGLRDFSGREHLVLPVLYSRPLSNPDDLSTDVFGALSAYSYASNVYHELDKVVDPLEVGRQIVNEQRKTAEVSRDKPVVERLGKDAQILSRIFQTGSSNIEAKLQDFMESQVYGRYYKDSDTVFKVGKHNVKVNKAINSFLSISSVAQLGFNFCANAANIATGLAMQNIEMACGQFFNAKELLKADGIYSKELMSFLPEMESRNKKSKLALFDELFDVKQDFKDNAGRSRVNGFLKRIFGETVAFIGQTCGDHWLYNRTAIAMALRTKVIANGKEMTLWDALEVKDKFKDSSNIKVLRLPKGTKDARTGRIIDNNWIGEWSESLKYVNHRLFGVYNSDDMVAAERTAAGRMLLQFRKWIVPQMAARFDGKKYILAINDYTEGYYRTMLNFMIGLKEGQGNIMRQWADLEDWQRANIKRSLFEITQFAAVWILSQMLLGGDKDPDRSWAKKFAEYMVQREVHELGNLTPSLTMGREILKTIQSPISAINSAQNVLNLVGSIIDPRDWNNELQTGNYEGHSTLYKHLMKAPLPILPQYRQMDRFLDDIDDATLYYTRSF